MYTPIALKIYSAICEGIIKSRTAFWCNFSSIGKIKSLNLDCSKYEQILKDNIWKITCCFDDDFPTVDKNVPLNEKPFFFVYRGNLKLLNDVPKNVAVIGVLTPTESIIEREKKIVSQLVKNDICIVSGLAKGCDSVAHNVCLNNGGKTVAFLPSTLNTIYPTENSALAEQIVANGGLIITEYAVEPTNYKENVSRLIERDRLQAMFSNSVVLIASYRKGEGDSGSRHAMIKAKKYHRQRFIMFNKATDNNHPIFGLNEDMLENGAKILTPNTIKELHN